MANAQYFKDRLSGLKPANFETLALELFRFQALENPVYRQYLKHLNQNPDKIDALAKLPFLPIEFFKTQRVSIYQHESPVVFSSSGTTGMQTSRHYLHDENFYRQGSQRAFSKFYGPVQQYCVLALLPGYLERQGSSLIYMAQHFISLSGDEDSGFFLHDLGQLSRLLQKKRAAGKKVLLLGVTFALLELAEKFPQDLSGVVVMETGGMKGRRKEMLRQEVHALLKEAFNIERVHSEYGMTELLSQAYSQGDGLFASPWWMQIRVRQVDDPFSPAKLGKTGGINVIDLANVESCAFIQTQDLGRLHRSGLFEIMGRFDHSDVRGCNLMVV